MISECKIIIFFFLNEQNICKNVFTVPGMYGNRNKMLLKLLRVLSGCYYLFIYAYAIKTASTLLYQILIAKLNPNFTFPNLRHPKDWFPNILFRILPLLSLTATDCLKRM